ncbi:MAG: alpha/beta hydrolase [Planctomycetia bacterium]|nr:alpha/beta hydrolase [Planctomycetia bacterium]
MNAPQLEETEALPSAPAGESGACPPPLAWQDVLREFHLQAHAWYLDRPNGRISGRMLGSGPPLYFLNGFAGSHELYSLLVWLLRDEFRCVVFDYPAPVRGSLTLDGLADDVVAVADTCGDRTFPVYGSSFGSLVALAAMTRHPDRIARAVLQAAFAHRQLSSVERFLISLCHVLPGKLQNVPARMAVQRQNHLRWFPPFDATRLQFYLDCTGRTTLANLARRGSIVRLCDLRPDLSRVEQPVLLIRSEGDGRVLADCCDALARGLPHATVEHLNDTGQIPFLTHPHRLAKLIRAFLAAPPV